MKKMSTTAKRVERSEYPKLMTPDKSRENAGKFVVLFYLDGTGVVVHVEPGHARHNVGDHSTTWAMDCFEDYVGTIVLEGK